MLTRWLLAWQTLALPLLTALRSGSLPAQPFPVPVWGAGGVGGADATGWKPPLVPVGLQRRRADVGARPELSFAICSHKVFPPSAAATGCTRSFRVSHAQSSLRSLPGGARGGAVGAVPYGVMDSRMFLGGDQPHTPLSSSRGQYFQSPTQLPVREKQRPEGARSSCWLGTELGAASAWEKGKFTRAELLTLDQRPLLCSHPPQRLSLRAGEAVLLLSWRAAHEDVEDADTAPDHLQVSHQLLLLRPRLCTALPSPRGPCPSPGAAGSVPTSVSHTLLTPPHAAQCRAAAPQGSWFKPTQPIRNPRSPSLTPTPLQRDGEERTQQKELGGCVGQCQSPLPCCQNSARANPSRALGTGDQHQRRPRAA